METRKKKLKCELYNESMQEEWRDVVGYEGFYQVSNLGRVRSVDRQQEVLWKGKKVYKPIKGRVIAQTKQNGGYLMANLSANGKRKECTVHRLVAMSFLDNPNKLKEVNHKDGNKENNNVSNLEWCSRSDNLKHRARILGQRGNAVRIKCVDTGEEFRAVKDAAEKVGVSDSAIYIALKKGGKYRSGGYRWERI